MTYLTETLTDNLALFEDQELIKGDWIFDIVDDNSFNAFASKKQGHDVICLNSGLVLGLFFIYARIVQLPGTFPWIRSDAAKTRVLVPFDVIPTSFLDLAALAAEDIIPPDRQRLELAQRLWRWSLILIVFHELGHIVHGHVDHLLQDTNSKIFNEIVGGKVQNKKWYEMRRAQESQADNLALLFTYLGLQAAVPQLPLWLSAAADGAPNKIAYLWSFATATVFTLFATLEGIVNGDRIGTSHPNPFERLAAILCADITSRTSEGLAKRSEGAMAEAFEAWRDLDKSMANVLQGFQGFFQQEEAIVPINFQTLTRNYPHYEEWSQFDRLTPQSSLNWRPLRIAFIS